MKEPAIADIKIRLNKSLDEFEQTQNTSLIDEFILQHQMDHRAGVKTLIKKATTTLIGFDKEVNRVNEMLSYENKYQEYAYIGGIDEAGRGPLAGPVVAACVILNKKDPIFYVNDSKKLSAVKRNILFDEICKRSVAFGIGVVNEKEIDEINILQATYKAMSIAISQCVTQPDFLLNDAVIIPGVTIPQEKIIKGDAKSLSIAAASILAKVTRDRIMEAYDELYPEYDFASNKGYGSAKHIDMIKSLGPSPIHRSTFIKNFV